jgi:transposase InsO family protein
VSKYEYIDSQKTEPANLNSVVKMCRWLGVSTSGFYHWLTRPQSAAATRRKALIARVQHYFEESEGTDGYRRIHADLAAEQTGCSPELVRQLLRQEGLVACQPRPFRVTTEADALAAANMPDLVKRDFTATRRFRALVTGLGMRSSMGRTGVCWDNSMAESFFSVLKNERVYRTVYATKSQARSDVIRYIEGFYNSRRRHSALGYRRPNEVHYGYPQPARQLRSRAERFMSGSWLPGHTRVRFPPSPRC